MHPKDAEGIANNVDLDQTAPLWYGSALFAQICLSENLETLRYVEFDCTGSCLGSFSLRSDYWLASYGAGALLENHYQFHLKHLGAI